MGRVARETISGAKWGLIQKCTMQPVQFVYGIILARLISPEAFGILGLTSIFFAIAAQLQSCGFGSALIRDIHRTDTDINTVFWTNLGLSAVLSTILFLCAPLFADFFHQPALIWLTRASALLMFLNSSGSVHWTLYSCRRDFKTPSIVGMATTLVAMPFCIWAAYAFPAEYAYWAVFLQGCVSGLLSLAVIWIISPWKPRLVWSKDSFKRYFAYGSKLMISGIVDSAFSNIKNLLIGKRFSAADLGLFNRAWHVASLPSGTINGLLGSVTFPILATIQEDESRLLTVYSLYIRITSLAIFFGSCLLIALARPTVLLLYGPQWEVCVGYLQIIVWGVMSFHYGTINNNLLLVKGRSDIVMRLTIIKKIISVALLAMAMFGTMYTVCWVSVIFIPFGIVLNSYYTGKLYGMTMRRQARDFLPYFVLSVLCCAPAYLGTLLPLHAFMGVPKDSYWEMAAQLAFGVPAATALYCGYLWLRKDEAYMLLLQHARESRFWPFKKRRA